MNALIVLALGLACSILVWRSSHWRSSHRFWHSVFAGIAVPLIGLIAFGALIGREDLEAMNPALVLLGTVGAIGVLAFICCR